MPDEEVTNETPEESLPEPKPGDKVVPLSALVEARQAKAELKKQLEGLQKELEEAKQAQQVIEALRPQLEALAAEAVKAAPPPDPELVELAKQLDLYDALGQPDTARVSKLLTAFEQRATRKAQEVVAPLARATAKERAKLNYQRALETQLPAGFKLDKTILDDMWKRVPEEFTQYDEVARLLVQAALGEQVRRGQLLNEPGFSELAGRTSKNPPEPTRRDVLIAKALGKKPEEWAKTVSAIEPDKGLEIED